MSKTYGEMLAEHVDEMAKYEDRAEIFRRNDIPRGHFYNVINPDRRTSGGNGFYAPIEWMVRLTRDSNIYKMLKTIASDCKCILITPDEIEELQKTDPGKALEICQKIVGLARRKAEK
jgi:hypothetical protein